jgi:hypothetical protein
MDIEQIGLFVVGWFAVGFIVALGLGKILREANNLGRLDTAARALNRVSTDPPVGYATHDRPIENKKTRPVESGAVRPS